MTISFEDYCDKYLDSSASLMNATQLKNAQAQYSKMIRTKKSPYEIAKKEKQLTEAKKSRKIAKFYGGKALTGSAAQKKWAEEIREKILWSSMLSDEQKIKLVTFGRALNTAKFWINNKDKSASEFTPDVIFNQYKRLEALYDAHYRTLVESGPVYEKELARKEIYQALSSSNIEITFEFPNCDFYDNYGNLKKEMTFRC